MKFELSFEQAISVLRSGQGWVQGSNFKSGVVLVNSSGAILIRDFNKFGEERDCSTPLTFGLVAQKYRVVKTETDAKCVTE